MGVFSPPERLFNTNSSRLAKGLVKPTLKSATPGDLSLVLPYWQIMGIIEMLVAMNKLMPGVGSSHTLLYGVDVKFYLLRLQMDEALETEIHNMFGVGNGAGISRGLSLASASASSVSSPLMVGDRIFIGRED